MSSRYSIIIIWLCVTLLLGLGLIMVTSTSVWTLEGADYGMVKKQIIFALLGTGVAVTFSCIDYHKYRPYVWWFYGVSTFLLVLCYVPGIHKEINGEFRWIGVGGLSIQPSECAKIFMIMALAHWYSSHKDKVRTLYHGFLVPMAIFACTIGLIFMEKDMGTALALSVAGFCVMFAAGTRPFYLISSGLLGMAGFFWMVSSNANRWNRILAFADLEGNKLKYGLQQWRALLALSNGGTFGVGLGNSTEKHGYLPYAHTDFILGPLGEEMGIVGTLGVLLAFGAIAFFGIMIAVNIKDYFGRLWAIGIVFIIFWPAMLNIGVVTACLPNSGLPLPFISYGGTNLIFTLGAIGILTSIQRWSSTPEPSFVEPVGHKKSVDIRL